MVLHGKLRNEAGVVAETFQCIGDAEIINKVFTVFEYDVFAVGDTTIAMISEEELKKCIGFLNSEDLKALKQVGILRSLPPLKFEAIVSCLKIQSFHKDQTIIEQNTPGDLFFLINNGKVDIVLDGVTLRTITKYFGERSLLLDEVRTASVVANTEVTCWTLSRQDFMSILDYS